MIFTTPSRELTGQFLIDDSFMASRGVTDFDQYRVDPTQSLAPDFFVPADSIPPVSLKALKGA
jgi:citronellol/citronellal dehydrogenase